MTAADLLSQKVSSLALAAHEIVVIVGLRQSSHLNYRPALLLSPSPEPDGRLRVQCLCDQQSFKVRRRNLLRASHPEERADLLSRIVWERQLELRVARSFLLESLRGEEGLALQIASHFPPRQTMALTTGFAMGKIVPDWSCAVIRQGKLCWQPIHGPKSRVYQKESVSDGIVRIDCAVVDIGSGCFLQAFMYDALTHVASPLPDMPCIRHGCGGAHIDGKVYIVGGEYAEQRPGVPRTFCSVFDLKRREWSTLSASLQATTRINQAIQQSKLAFVPVGAVWGRLVVLVEGSPIAFNPKKPAGGWRLCVPTQTSQLLSLGESAMASVEWGDRLVVATGRGGERRCNVASLSFKYPPGDADAINGSDDLLTTSSTSSDSAETSGVLLSVIVDR
ncbi:MAG: hypothetical protein SGPRY_005304 [Prymnesium sp.]